MRMLFGVVCELAYADPLSGCFELPKLKYGKKKHQESAVKLQSQFFSPMKSDFRPKNQVPTPPPPSDPDPYVDEYESSYRNATIGGALAFGALVATGMTFNNLGLGMTLVGTVSGGVVGAALGNLGCHIGVSLFGKY